MEEMLRSALAVMSRQPNSFALFQAWELQLRGIDPLELLVVNENGERPLDAVLHFSEAFREQLKKREAVQMAELALRKARQS